MDSPLGAFALVLHSHLPYVLSHDRLEEEWLFEAVAESYLPLLQAFDRLRLHGVLPKVTIGLTPVLLDQLADPRFAPGFLSYLEQKAARRTRGPMDLSSQRKNAIWRDWQVYGKPSTDERRRFSRKPCQQTWSERCVVYKNRGRLNC